MTPEEIDRKARNLSSLFSIFSWPPFAWLASVLSCLPIPIECWKGLLYQAVKIQFMKRHDCRGKPMPLALFKSVAGGDTEIHDVLMGPSDFFHAGILKNWDSTKWLSEICCPTLILSGFYDKATLDQMVKLRDGIRDSEQIILLKSSHLGMWEEEKEEYRKAILDFVKLHD